VFISTKLVRTFVLGVGLLMAASVNAAAQAGGGAAPAAGGGGGAAPQTPFTYRHDVMEGFTANMTALTAIRNNQAGNWNHALARAIMLQQLASMMPDLFPEGAPPEGSRALPAIWSNPTGFAERIKALQDAADNLVTAARGGNQMAIAEAQTALQGTCGACHREYRGPAIQQPAAR
jgi:cytochrome c556